MAKANRNTDATGNDSAKSTEIAPVEQTAVAAASPAPKFKLLRRVTRELFKILPGTENYFKSEGAIYQGKPIKETVTSKKKEPAMLMDVIDLASGVSGMIICGAVLQSVFSEEYPDASYVGKSFVIRMYKIPGKDYNGYDIAEIEVE